LVYGFRRKIFRKKPENSVTRQDHREGAFNGTGLLGETPKFSHGSIGVDGRVNYRRRPNRTWHFLLEKKIPGIVKKYEKTGCSTIAGKRIEYKGDLPRAPLRYPEK
jgi:hypothetical protein